MPDIIRCKCVMIPLNKDVLETVDTAWLEARGHLDHATGKWWIRSVCPHLTNKDRCGIYDKRPRSCASFQPGSSDCLATREEMENE